MVSLPVFRGQVGVNLIWHARGEKREDYGYPEVHSYAGGAFPAMLKFIAKNFRYSDKPDFQASFRIQFVVDIDGSIIAATIKHRNKNERSPFSILLYVDLSTPIWLTTSFCMRPFSLRIVLMLLAKSMFKKGR